MSPATKIFRKIDKELIQKLFHKFGHVYGALWTGRCKTEDDWRACTRTWLEALEHFEYKYLVSAVKDALLQYKEFPPTLPQLIDLCFQHTGVPPEHRMLKLMVERDFSHPLVKLCYDRFGAWELANRKEQELSGKLRAVYREAEAEYRANPQAAWKALEAIVPASDQKLISNISKIPAESEVKEFKERLKEHQDKVVTNRAMAIHPVWDQNKTTVGHRNFDRNVYEERRKYLTDLSEDKAAALNSYDWYDRSRYLREIAADNFLITQGNKSNDAVDEPIKRNNQPVKIYKSWMKD